jgi:hypothetical protein
MRKIEKSKDSLSVLTKPSLPFCPNHGDSGSGLSLWTVKMPEAALSTDDLNLIHASDSVRYSSAAHIVSQQTVMWRCDRQCLEVDKISGSGFHVPPHSGCRGAFVSLRTDWICMLSVTYLSGTTNLVSCQHNVPTFQKCKGPWPKLPHNGQQELRILSVSSWYVTKIQGEITM